MAGCLPFFLSKKKKLFWMTMCLRFNFPAFLTAIEESERGKQQFFVGLLEK